MLRRWTCSWRHYAHTHAVWCSWCTLEWLGYPYDELMTARAIKGREKIWVASRFLTTKIPTALLVVVVWLQHTWYPRSCHGTFGYGITTSPTRGVEYEHRVFMRMHVSIPKLPRCISDAVHAQKQHFKLNHKVLSKTKKNKFRIEESIGSLIGTKFVEHRTWLIRTSMNHALWTLLLKEKFNPCVTSTRVFRIAKQCLELQCRLAAQQGS
jgi:hypothetical protein